MNVEIGTEAAQFPEKEYINGIFVAVHNMCNHDICINAFLYYSKNTDCFAENLLETNIMSLSQRELTFLIEAQSKKG